MLRPESLAWWVTDRIWDLIDLLAGAISLLTRLAIRIDRWGQRQRCRWLASPKGWKQLEKQSRDRAPF